MSTSLIISTPGATANCYVAAATESAPAEADAYFANTLREETWTAWDTVVREKALIQATQEIEALGGEWQPLVGDWEAILLRSSEHHFGRARFFGVPHLATQNLHFPRAEDLTAAGGAAVPQNVKAAVCEQAYYLLTKRDNPDLLPREELRARGVRSVSLDGLSESYGNAQIPDGIAPAAYRLIRPYLDRSIHVEPRV